MNNNQATIGVDSDEICCFCFSNVTHGGTYYRPYCNHLYCLECISDPRLKECTRCTRKFISYEAVTVFHAVDITGTD